MTDSLSAAEAETIYPIPLNRRHGRPLDLFTVWFGPNLMMLTVVTGALSTTVFGLPVGPALISILAGNLAGAIFMALHAAQGPRLGVPQMVQTRGQFGLIGAAPVTALIVLMYVGFAASNLILGAEGLQSIIPHMNRLSAIMIIQILSVIPAFLGYRMIHLAAKFMSFACGIAIMFCIIRVSLKFGGTVLHPDAGHITSHGILSTISTTALWQIAYAPYVSDSSRYLPPGKTGEKQAFIACFLGSVLGSVLAMTLGAVVGILAAGHAIVATLAGLLDGWALPVIVALSLGIAVANAMNIYCGALSSLTVAQTFTPDRRYDRAERMIVTAVLLLLAFCMATLMAGSFMAAYSEFLELLMSVMIPWTAINLTDYYVLHHGDYDVASFFARDGGKYGRYNKPALACYVFGILIQIPFLSSGLYTGPVARMLGGVDISWVVSLCLTTPLYIATERRFNTRALPVAAQTVLPK
ncbi:purine-cytosine permease family protein [Acetobacter oeni]|uniref:Allantoin permease n=1 Tax=Acetobacter oeni TaxID=304077 RepID=A0A511XPF8_9PROT|nr:cytosine permease [Acetobacter oeni]MBB3884618.1 NCS1 family nucleobase:cation symporter-1 [Acetobacter oeni]NHO20573.1 cytosine permease [Acetobacter oeni]GBR05063.1 cytosine/purines/uracil/thiamine/allantoin transporter [Acetobacter oeni LMG 21952]GEN64843.1 allantoin permease [Acetobacter oeni]